MTACGGAMADDIRSLAAAVHAYARVDAGEHADIEEADRLLEKLRRRLGTASAGAHADNELLLRALEEIRAQQRRFVRTEAQLLLSSAQYVGEWAARIVRDGDGLRKVLLRFVGEVCALLDFVAGELWALEKDFGPRFVAAERSRLMPDERSEEVLHAWQLAGVVNDKQLQQRVSLTMAPVWLPNVLHIPGHGGRSALSALGVPATWNGKLHAVVCVFGDCGEYHPENVDLVADLLHATLKAWQENGNDFESSGAAL